MFVQTTSLRACWEYISQCRLRVILSVCTDTLSTRPERLWEKYPISLRWEYHTLSMNDTLRENWEYNSQRRLRVLLSADTLSTGREQCWEYDTLRVPHLEYHTHSASCHPCWEYDTLRACWEYNSQRRLTAERVKYSESIILSARHSESVILSAPVHAESMILSGHTCTLKYHTLSGQCWEYHTLSASYWECDTLSTIWSCYYANSDSYKKNRQYW